MNNKNFTIKFDISTNIIDSNDAIVSFEDRKKSPPY